MGSFTNIKSVAVIGAGPAGLAAVKYLKAENCFDSIVAFEQRHEVGGVWNFTGNVSKQHQSDLTIPRTKPAGSVERAVSTRKQTGSITQVFPSPIYDALETNIPHTLMNYTDKPFPTDCPLFPPFDTVKRYLEEYAGDIRSHLKLGTQIERVRLITGAGVQNTKWTLRYIDLTSGTSCEESFDAVVCASGHYSDPFIPDIPGISEFDANHPGVISHSKYYRSPRPYANKKVVIVGNSASGVDISRQISTFAAHVIVSEKEKPKTLHSDSESITYRPEIAEFIADSRTIRFVNGDAETEVDHIVFCTGYQYSFPFLKDLEEPVATTGERTSNVYQHIFYHPQPTLAFLTLPQRIVPFPVAEAQAAYVARVFSGRLALPTLAEMKTWEHDVLQAKGSKGFHNLGFPEDVDYINALYSISMSARNCETRGEGKTPPFWDEEKRWTRQQFPMIKQAALKLGESRRDVRCLRDLGFDFEAWKREEHLKQKVGP
ncbi:thiol-specific monooxygenase [Karstenula rhodostoma CBS 690.94]|uniref:Thiol-specific monooxygenase n=1 Tax=Karstenula rhodostoma CBS 690.94 TaxID=1392251 RepID=A0A9P4P5P1_9PLEO|nr:thiol-specific monooxygenase [Karstenula rhodostoma CBS 690.94]